MQPAKTRTMMSCLAIPFVLILLIPYSSSAHEPPTGRRLATPAGGNVSSPTPADIDADGRDEILWGTGNAVYCYDCNGGVRWARDTAGRVSGSPAACDINGDGRMEVFVGNEAAWLWGFDAAGNNLPGWPVSLPPPRACSEPGCFSSPAIGDIDGDGAFEIVIGTWGNRLWAFRGNAAVVPGFPIDMRDTIWSSPAIGDVNGDGLNEIVVGSDCTAGADWPYPSGGLLWVVNGAGQSLPGWPKWTPQVIWSSPALGDLNGDKIADIVVGTGFYFSGVGGTYYYGWDGWGNNLPGWPVDIGCYTMDSPALGDINGDGWLEVATLRGVYAHDGVKLQGNGRDASYNSQLSSASLGDTNGDGVVEKIMGEANAPAIGDFDRDGRVDVVKTPPAVNHTGAPYRPELCPWPMFHHDPRHTGLVPPPPRPNYETYLLLVNPGTAAADITVDFMLEGDPPLSKEFEVGPKSRKTVFVNDEVGFGKNVSTRVTSPEPVMAERSMYFNSGGRTDGHCSIGAAQPSTQWYLAEGYSGGSFDTWILVQNPNAEPANVIATLMKPDGSIHDIGFAMPPASRQTIHADDAPGFENCEFSSQVFSTLPVVAERAMYFNYGGITGGTESIGLTAPSQNWFLSEGCTGWGFDTYVLVQNPGAVPATVDYTFMREDGANIVRSVTLPPHSRYTVKADDVPGLEGCNFSTSISATQPVCCERAMYFDNGGRNGGHCSIGTTEPAAAWYLAEGYTAESFDTWVLLQNPTSATAEVVATFMKPDGTSIDRAYSVKPNSRWSIHVDEIPGLEAAEFSTAIQSTNQVDFIAERAMYFNYKGIWDGGHGTIGARAPSCSWYFAEGYTGK